jgi:hypothetical protein
MRAADDSTQSTQLFALPARGNRSSHNGSTLACTACGSGSITLLRSRSEYVAQHHRLDAGPRCDTTDAGARLAHSHGRRRHSGVQRARQHHLMPGFPRSSDDAGLARSSLSTTAARTTRHRGLSDWQPPQTRHRRHQARDVDWQNTLGQGSDARLIRTCCSCSTLTRSSNRTTTSSTRPRSCTRASALRAHAAVFCRCARKTVAQPMTQLRFAHS